MRLSSPFAVRGSGSELDGLANCKIASFNTAQRSGLIRRPAKLIFFANLYSEYLAGFSTVEPHLGIRSIPSISTAHTGGAQAATLCLT
jgi:hypothetical protein